MSRRLTERASQLAPPARVVRFGWAIYPVLILAACDSPSQPDNGLEIDLVVEPAVVAPGDSMAVTLTIRNPTSGVVGLSSGNSCIAVPEVRGGRTGLPWQGTGWACLTVISSFDIVPEDSIQLEFPLTALLQEQQSPWRYVIEPAPGRYRLVMRMQVDLPDIDTEFRVVN